MQLIKVQNNMHDWIRYILFTGADEHGHQHVQNKTTGRSQRQGGSSCTTAPAAAVPAQTTGIQPRTLQLHALCSTLSLKSHP